MLLSCLVFALSTGLSSCGVPNTPGFQIANTSAFQLIATSAQSSYYRVSVAVDGAEVYNDMIYFVRLVGSRYQIGVDFATLVGSQVVDCYDAVIKNSGINFAERKMLETFADQQWSMYLSKQVPDQYMTELSGIHSVSRNVYEVVTRVFVLANLPSDLPEDMIPILQDEGSSEDYSHLYPLLSKLKSLQCSMYAAWGSRTVDRQLYSCRNLDYSPDTGINVWKSVTLWVPDDGAIPHAAYGFIAMYGVIAGMSKKHITVHEANLEETNETFRGFPWVIRLRYIMENANDLDQAIELWKRTNNTIGYNHMIAWQPPPGVYYPHQATVIETSATYNGFFHDMDPRENGCVVNGQVIGYPLPEALYRTNHPYDPNLMADYLWYTYFAYQYSVDRYMYGYETIFGYENAGTIIGDVEAVNISSTMADKGPNSPFLCVYPYASTAGTNVLSVTYKPGEEVAFVAWENGTGNQWSPACCNTYVRFDMKPWW